MSQYYENVDRFVHQSLKPFQKKQSQDTINRFIKTLVKLFSENHTDKRMYVRLVADKPS